MAGNWPIVRVEDVCSLIVDCVNKTAPVSIHPTKFRMIRTTNVRNGKIDLSDCRYVDEETYKKWTRRARLEAGDVILTREAPIGEVGQIPEQDGLFLGQRLMQYRADPEKMDSRFLLYSFLSPQLQQQFGSHEGSGSVVSHIRVGDCFKFEMRLPPLAVQKRIGEILGSLDEKIDLNRCINQTLEAMAQAIFKSWFVDFDPVKAKIAAIDQGEDPLRAAMRAISGKTDAELDQMPCEHHGQLAATAALFPDAMQESELGEIPEGWEVVPLSKMIRLIGGGTPKRSESSYWGGTVPWFSVKDVPNDGDVWVVDTDEKITEMGLQKSSAKLLRKGTTIISARGTVGKLAVVGREMAMNQSCYGVVGSEGVGDYFNYFNLKEAIETLKRNTHGAVFDTITQATFETVICVRPNVLLMQQLEDVVTPLLIAIKSNVLQSRELVDLRDTILPKLLSGELSVGSVDEEAAV